MVGKYEIGFIVSPEATEEEVAKITDAVTGIIKKANGRIDNVEEWGRKPLSYPLQKQNEGHYVFVQTEAEGQTMTGIERRLRQIEKVMRFIVLRLDDKLKKTNKLTKRWNKMEQIRRRAPAPSEESDSEEFSENQEENHAE